MNEADTRFKLINPLLAAKGWTGDLISCEQSLGKIDIGTPDSPLRQRADSEG